MIESFKQRLSAPPPPSRSYSLSPGFCVARTQSIVTLDCAKQSVGIMNDLFSNISPLTVDFSTTPPGSPPPNAALSGADNKPPVAAGMSNIMQTLATLARQNNSAAAPQPQIPPPAQSGAYAASVTPSNPTPQGLPQALAQFLPPTQQPQQSQAAPPVNPLAGLPFPPPPNLQPLQGQAAAANPLLALLGQANGFAQAQPPPVAAPVPSPAPAPASGVDPKIQQQLLLIQTLAAQGVPVETITAILGQLSATNAAPGQPPPPHAPTPVSSAYLPPGTGGNNQQSSSYGGSWAPPPQSRADESRDRDGHYRNPMRSPNRFRDGRSRSRSPQRRWDQSDSPRNGRDHGRNSPGRRDGGHDSYRQRSPPGGRPDDDQPPPQKDKWVEYDNSLPSGTIKGMWSVSPGSSS
jgi:protein NRD1